MRDWLVGGGIVCSGGAVLLVQNRRRDGRLDWSPPGGVIDPGETLLEGLGREVLEETGLRVARWLGPSYEILAEAPDMGWRLRVEVFVAEGIDGELAVCDPDGIVVAAGFVPVEQCAARLADAPRWVREPLADWLAERWSVSRTYSYRVDGTSSGGDMSVRRIEPGSTVAAHRHREG